jgi:hypothetical protein
MDAKKRWKQAKAVCADHQTESVHKHFTEQMKRIRAI